MLDPERRILTTRVQYWSDTGQQRELDKASGCSIEEEDSRSELKKTLKLGCSNYFHCLFGSLELKKGPKVLYNQFFLNTPAAVFESWSQRTISL